MPLIIEAPKPLTRITAAIRRELRIVFFGTPLFAVPTLRMLHEEGWPVELVVTAPDKPVGRRMLLTPSPVKTAATELGLPILTPQKLSDESCWAQFSELRPDLCVVVAYGKIIPKRYLDLVRLGFINIHPSLLPRYRGPSPIASAILDGTTETGVSIMLLDEEMDHGPLLAQEPWTIPSGFDTPMAEDELSRRGAHLLSSVLPAFIDGTVTPRPQNHAAATYCSKFTRADGKLDWAQPAPVVVNRIRALAANPGTWTTWNGKTLNIHHAHIFSAPVPVAVPGTVQLLSDEVVVTTATGAVALEVVQSEGGKRMTAAEFVRGHTSFVGSRCTDEEKR